MKYMKYPERFKINRYYKLRSEYISRYSKHTEDIRPTEIGGTPLQEYNPVQDFVNTFNKTARSQFVCKKCGYKW